jgi:hypothetical protein
MFEYVDDDKLEELMHEAAEGMVFSRKGVAEGWAIKYNILSNEFQKRQENVLKEKGYTKVFTYELPNHS